MSDVNRMRRVWLAVVILAGGILIGGLWFVPGPLGAHTGGGGMMGLGQNIFEECMEMMCRYGYSQYPSSPKSQKSQTEKALTRDDAISIVQDYLSQTRNPNLIIGEVEIEEDGDYLVEIVTKDGSLADKLEEAQSYD